MDQECIERDIILFEKHVILIRINITQAQVSNEAIK